MFLPITKEIIHSSLERVQLNRTCYSTVTYDNSSTFSSQAKKFIHNSVAYMKSSLCVNVWLNSTNFKFNTNPHLLSISVFKTCMSH